MYQIVITDETTSATLPVLNVPLTQQIIEGAKDVETLDLNLYTDFVGTKRLWAHTWKYMTEAQFNTLKGFYDRQFTLLEFPTITISELDVTDIVVRMNLSPQNIIDHCGTVEDVDVSFRETVQMSEAGGSS